MKKWEVFKDGNSLGLMTAKDIRRALREGTIDPFDMVCTEGSTIKSELVEVDEIFNEETNSGAGSGEDSKIAPPDIPSKIINLEQPTEEVKVRHFPEPAPLDQDSRMTASAMNRAIRAESRGLSNGNNSSDKKKAKKFFLIDEKKRVLGPVSATEIQSLFQRGIISNSVKVQKVDGKKMIPVRQFIANYSEKRIKALADQAAASKTGNPSSKVLNELYQNMNSKKMAQKKMPIPIFAIVGVMMLLVVGYFVYSSGVLDNSKNRRRVVKQAAPEMKLPPQDVPPVVESSPPPVPAREVKKTPVPAVKEIPPKPKVKLVKPTPKPKPTPPPRRVATPKPTPPAPTPRPEPRRVETPSQPKARPANVNRKGPIDKAMEKAGSVVTVGPLVFKEQELESCALKCRLKFRDNRGETLEAVFFKGAYYDILKGNTGGVTITGSSKVEGNTLVVFIQDVR